MMTILYVQISMAMFHQIMMTCWVVVNLRILWMMTINLIITLDQILMMMMMMIRNTSFQIIMDHHLMMTWTCQEFRTRGKHMTQVHHQLRFPILMSQWKRLLWRSFTRRSNFWTSQSSKETETNLNWFYWFITTGKGQGDYQEAKGSITRSRQTYLSSYSETWWWRGWRTFTWS